MNAIKTFFGGNVRQFGMVGALVVLIGLFQFMSDGNVLTPGNMQNLINGNAYVLVLAIGMVLVIITGHIDLSVGSVAAFAGVSVAMMMTNWGLPWWAGILAGIVLGALAGAWQGFWVAYVGVPAFITTLAGMLLFRGLNQMIGNQNTIPVPEKFQFIGSGYFPEIGPVTGYNNVTLLLGIVCIVYLWVTTLLRRRKQIRLGSDVVPFGIDIARLVIITLVIGYLTYLFSTGRPGTSFPISGVILLILVVIYQFITSRTVAGRAVYAVGGNRQAAALSGVRDKRVDFFVMMNMSILAALAGMMFVARSNASGPADGVGWELDAIAAVFIGGAAVSGGIGTVVGSVIGGLVMAVLNNGMYLLGVGSAQTSVIKGLVLLIAVAFDVWSKKQGRPSVIGMFLNARRRPETQAEPVPQTQPVTQQK